MIQTSLAFFPRGVAHAGMTLCNAAPLGPTLAYVWSDENGAGLEALLELELGGLCRVHLTVFNEDGSLLSRSGWHGMWSSQTYSRTVARPKSRLKPREPVQMYALGDTILELHAFRFEGVDASWTHEMKCLQKCDTDVYEFHGVCGGKCKTCHRISFRRLVGPTRRNFDVTPGPSVVLGCWTR